MSECQWAADEPSATTSYRFCADAECPEPPAIDCPEGTAQSSQQCGSENDAACVWTTACVPPRLTTPCANSSGCDALPLLDIGVICKDGRSGGFACVTDGQSCRWERDCD